MKKILILSSNPREDLKLNRELQSLKEALERAVDRGKALLEIEPAVRPSNSKFKIARMN